MNTPKPVLNRMPQLRFLQGYRRQLAQTASGWTDNPALAKAALNDVMEIRSLQTEGILKYDLNSLDPAKYSEAEFKSLVKEKSTLPLLADCDPLDEEAKAVLRDVAAVVAKKAGSLEGFVFQPVTHYADVFRAQAYRISDGMLQMYDVCLHDTPGLENGLMAIRPTELGFMIANADQTRQKHDHHPLIRLDRIEEGWLQSGAPYPPKFQWEEDPP